MTAQKSNVHFSKARNRNKIQAFNQKQTSTKISSQFTKLTASGA